MSNLERIKRNRKINLKVLLFGILAILFLSVRPIFTYDGVWYLGYLDYLDGTLPFNEWNDIRGFVYPLILYVGYLLCPEGGYGVNVVFLFFYLLMFFYVLKIIDLYREELLHNTKLIWIDYSVAILAIALNPFIWGYYHFVLTESISLTFLVIFFYYSLSWGIKRLRHEESIRGAIEYISFSTIMLILTYFLKQSYFGIVAFILIGLEALIIIVKREKKQILYSLCLFCVLGITMLGTVKVWDALTTNDSSNYIASQVSRLRYFSKENNWLYDQSQTVEITDDDDVVLEQFEYEFGSGILDGVEYIFFCLRKNPERVLAGWRDNYMALCGIYQVPINEQFAHSTGKVVKENIFTNIFGVNEGGSISTENKITVIGCIKNGTDMEARISEIKASMSTYGTYHSEKIDEFTYSTGGNIVTQSIYNIASVCLTYGTFSLFSFFTPFFLIWTIIKMIKKKNIEKYLGEFLAACFGSLYLLMMTVMGQIIDRYVIQVYFMNLVIFVVLVGKVLTYYMNRSIFAETTNL